MRCNMNEVFELVGNIISKVERKLNHGKKYKKKSNKY